MEEIKERCNVHDTFFTKYFQLDAIQNSLANNIPGYSSETGAKYMETDSNSKKISRNNNINNLEGSHNTVKSVVPIHSKTDELLIKLTDGFQSPHITSEKKK